MPAYPEESLLSKHDWSLPIPIAYGPGRLNEIDIQCHKFGIKRPLIITDKGSENLSFINQLRSVLSSGGLSSGLYSAISPNPRDHEIYAARSIFRDGGYDAIIGVGGGSGMDAGKATCLLANNDHDIWSFDYDLESPVIRSENAFPPLICIPTTSGTGAETESTAMITDTSKMMKLCVWHPELKPSLALLDPELTVGLPAQMTAWTGVDALVHAIEAFCVPDFNPICDGIALEALGLISRWLVIAVDQPGNIKARGGMQIGSCLAGVSFLKGLGLVHGISHMVGADFDTHHGLTNAIVLPSVLRFNASSIKNKIQPLATALGLKDSSFESFYSSLCLLLDELSIPATLAEIGVKESDVDSLAIKAQLDAATATNPLVPNMDELKAVITEAIKVGR